MDYEIVKIVSKILGVVDWDKIKCKAEPKIDGWYFWIPSRSGAGVLINKNKEVLTAGSAIPYKKHLEMFISGKRNQIGGNIDGYTKTKD